MYERREGMRERESICGMLRGSKEWKRERDKEESEEGRE